MQELSITFEFPEYFNDSNVCEDFGTYQRALQRIRFDIQHGGLGLTSATPGCRNRNRSEPVDFDRFGNWEPVLAINLKSICLYSHFPSKRCIFLIFQIPN